MGVIQKTNGGSRASSLVTTCSSMLVVAIAVAGRCAMAADGSADARAPGTEVLVPKGTAKKSIAVPSAPTKVVRYAERLLEKYDLNRDGVLQKDEWMALHGHPELIDTNRDGNISLEEMSNWVSDYGRRKRLGTQLEPAPAAEQVVNATTPAQASPTQTKPEAILGSAEEASAAAPTSPAAALANGERRRDSKFFVPSNRLPAGLPDWFIAKDIDGDGQLTVGEYSPTSNSQELADFAKLDANGDGLMTAKECVGRPAAKQTKKVADSAGEGNSSDSNPNPAKPGRSRRKTGATP